MSSIDSSTHKRSQDNDQFEDLEEYLSTLRKEDLINIVRECWPTSKEVILKSIVKKKKLDQEAAMAKKLRIEEDKKDIVETNWIFTVYDHQVINIKEGVIKLGMHREGGKDLTLSKNGEWNEEGELVFTIYDNGCSDCSGSNEVLTLKIERDANETKKRVRLSGYVECYCTYDHGLWPLRTFACDCDDIGYPDGEEEQNEF